MFDRLPTELLLVIVELAAPRTAQHRYRLFVEEGAVRPLIWTEVWIFERMASALVNAVERDPSFAPFTKRLICYRMSINALVALHRVFPRFNNVRSIEIHNSGTREAPLELSTIEQLGALKDLSLEACWIAPTLPRLDQLETLCLRSFKLGIPLEGDVPLAPTRIITDLSSASQRTLRLLGQTHPILFRNPNSPLPDFSNITLLELDGISFQVMRELGDAFVSLTCRAVLKCEFNDLDPALVPYDRASSALPLPADFEIWVRSDALPGSSRQSSTRVERHLQALISVAPSLSALTLPLNLGIGRSSEDILRVRTPIYALLKRFAKDAVPVRFHQEPWHEHGLLQLYFRKLDEFAGEGYFSDLAAGRVVDPELRDFRVVVV